MAVRWVDIDSYHVTLKFFGDVRSDRLAGIEEAIRPHVPQKFQRDVIAVDVDPAHRHLPLAKGLRPATNPLALLLREIQTNEQAHIFSECESIDGAERTTATTASHAASTLGIGTTL